MIRRWVPIRVLVPALLILLALSAGAFAFSYPGLMEDGWQELRYADFSELEADARFFFYNIKYFQKLRRDPTGKYTLPPTDEQDRFAQAMISYHRGELADAIHSLEADIEHRGETERKLLWLALAHQRRAEQQGCLHELEHGSHAIEPVEPSPFGELRHHRICSLPLAANAEAEPGMKKAAEHFRALLDRYDPESPLYRWLLTFSTLAAGGSPEDVPEHYAVQGPFMDTFYGETYRATAMRFDHLEFHDRAAQLGVDVFDAGKGVAVEDFDGDGFLDLVTGGSFSHVRFFHNDRGRGFVEQTEQVGLGGVLQPFIITAADYDNDGWMDLFISRPYHVFALYRNRGDGTFEETTRAAGLLDGIRPDQSVFTFVSAWSDVDNDGDLDLFLAQLGRKLPLSGGLLGKSPMGSALFLNHHGHFRDVTREFGLGAILKDRTYTGAVFGDYDNDGDQDLFLSSFTRGLSVLLRNVDGAAFEKTDLIGSHDPGFMAGFVDVNHDGRLDLFQGSNGPAEPVVEQVVFQSTDPPRYTQKLFLQNDHGFELRQDLFGRFHISSMGASFGDLDNDGCHDFYLGTGNSEPTFVLPNLMFLGQSEGTRCTGGLTHISMLNGFGSIQKGHGIVFFDFDNDGDQDIYSSLGGMWPSDPWPNQLFVNESRLERSWIKIRLLGRTSNRFGAGAHIRVEALNAHGQTIVRHRSIGPKTSFGSAPYSAHIGLMDAVRLERVEVRWPGAPEPVPYDARLNAFNLLDEHGSSTSSSSPVLRR